MADIDLTPTEEMAANAKRGLELRRKHGRGGTAVGVARARDISNRKTLSPETVRRMHAFFSRHEKNKAGGEDDAGYIAWLLWGGDAGQGWAKRKVEQMDKSENQRSETYKAIAERLGSAAKFAITKEQIRGASREELRSIEQRLMALAKSGDTNAAALLDYVEEEYNDRYRGTHSRPGAKAVFATEVGRKGNKAAMITRDGTGTWYAYVVQRGETGIGPFEEMLGTMRSYATEEKAKRAAIKALDTSGFSRPGAKASFAQDARAVAQEILRQLGGGRFMAMVGGKNAMHGTFGGKPGLQVSIGKGAEGGVNRLIVTLDPATDTYDMEFWRIGNRGLSTKKVSEASMVYADDLQRVFTDRTKFYTSMSRPGAKAKMAYGVADAAPKFTKGETVADAVHPNRKGKVVEVIPGSYDAKSYTKAENQYIVSFMPKGGLVRYGEQRLVRASRPGAKAEMGMRDTKGRGPFTLQYIASGLYGEPTWLLVDKANKVVAKEHNEQSAKEMLRKANAGEPVYVSSRPGAKAAMAKWTVTPTKKHGKDIEEHTAKIGRDHWKIDSMPHLGKSVGSLYRWDEMRGLRHISTGNIEQLKRQAEAISTKQDALSDVMRGFSRPGAKAKMGRMLHLHEVDELEEFLDAYGVKDYDIIKSIGQVKVPKSQVGKALDAIASLNREIRKEGIGGSVAVDVVPFSRPGAKAKFALNPGDFKQGERLIKEASALREKIATKRIALDSADRTLVGAIQQMKNALATEDEVNFAEAMNLIRSADKVRASFARPGAKAKMSKETKYRVVLESRATGKNIDFRTLASSESDARVQARAAYGDKWEVIAVVEEHSRPGAKEEMAHPDDPFYVGTHRFKVGDVVKTDTIVPGYGKIVRLIRAVNGQPAYVVDNLGNDAKPKQSLGRSQWNDGLLVRASRPGAKDTNAVREGSKISAEDEACLKVMSAADEKVSDKIRTLIAEGKPQKQAVAIALDLKRRGEL